MNRAILHLKILESFPISNDQMMKNNDDDNNNKGVEKKLLAATRWKIKRIWTDKIIYDGWFEAFAQLALALVQ